MAVIGSYNSAIAGVFAEAAVEAKGEKRLMREADVDRQISDVEKRMALEQIASSQRQFELTTNIAQKGASTVQNGIQLGQKLGDVGEHMRINSDLHSGAANYSQDHGAQMLQTDLGNGVTVEDALGTDAQGRRIEDPGERHRVAEQKLDALMSGNFSSAEDLQRLGFSEGEAQALMGLKDRGAGNELTQDEAIEFLFNRSPVVQADQARDRVHKGADLLIKDAIFAAPQAMAKQGQKAAKEAARTVDSDREGVRRDRTGQSRMSWLATENLNQAGSLVLNKRDQSFKP